MSRNRQRIEQLTRIRELRALTERITEMRASGLAREAEAQRARFRSEDELLEQALLDWHRGLAAGHFDPLHSAMFSQAVDRQNRAASASYRELDRLIAARDEALHESSRARAGHRCAAELLGGAQRRDMRRREERALAAQHDTNSTRRQQR